MAESSAAPDWTPGLRTLKNLLAAALVPMGRALYVYGGGWNFQDTGAGAQAVSIGIAPTWDDFFCKQDACYDYRRFGQENGKNPYCAAGLDCSGYLGWTVYNTLCHESGGEGYVVSAAQTALDFSTRDWGDWTQVPGDPLRPGDVCSIRGHSYLCMGTCGDGSVLLAHSTPSPSCAGFPGGGVQLSAISHENRGSCAALSLAAETMGRLAPRWTARYAPVLKDYALYTDFPGGGRFRWALRGGVLTDPDGVAGLGAEALMEALLKE